MDALITQKESEMKLLLAIVLAVILAVPVVAIVWGLIRGRDYSENQMIAVFMLLVFSVPALLLSLAG